MMIGERRLDGLFFVSLVTTYVRDPHAAVDVRPSTRDGSGAYTGWKSQRGPFLYSKRAAGRAK